MNWHALPVSPCELGESPFWHPVEQRLYWVDIQQCLVHRFDPSSQAAESWSMPSEPGCIAPVSQAEQTESLPHPMGGALVIALRDGIYRTPHWRGELVRLACALHDPATHRFNDGKADPAGRFWVSNVNEARTSASAELLSLEAPGPADNSPPPLRIMAAGATVGNGLAWSPDAQTVYWADTTTHTIRAWDWDAQHNQMSAERVFKQWAPKPPHWQAGATSNPPYAGRPDGAAVDAAGNYYIAMYEGAQILKLSAAGEVLQEMAVPAQCPTMPCLGGPDGRTLYVTTARQKRPDAELRLYPESGCVFTLRVDTPGLPVNFYCHHR